MLLDSEGQRRGRLLSIPQRDGAPNVITAEVEKLRSKWMLPSLDCGEGLGVPTLSLPGGQHPQFLAA